MRLSLCQTVAGGGHKLGTALNMALWCSNAGVAQKVRYFGVEVLTPEGRKAIAAKARKRANEAGLEVLPAAQVGGGYAVPFTSMRPKKSRAADLRGKVVLIDCWSTTCSPCMEKMPKLKALYEKHRKNGLEIIGISLDQDAKTVEQACATHGMTWPPVLVPVDD